MSNEIAFKPDAAMEAATRADFTYKIALKTVTITDTTLGKLSVTKDKPKKTHMAERSGVTDKKRGKRRL